MPNTEQTPLISREISQSIYIESQQDPYKFVKETVKRMSDQNPLLAERSIGVALVLSFIYTPESAYWSTRTFTLIYSAFDNHERTRGQEIPEVHQGIYEKVNEPMKKILEKAGKNSSERRIRQMNRLIEASKLELYRSLVNNNPELVKAVEALALDSQSDDENNKYKPIIRNSAGETYQIIDLVYQDKSKPRDEKQKQQIPQGVLPVVRRSVINNCLLDVATKPEDFFSDSIKALSLRSPDMAARLREPQLDMLTFAGVYRLAFLVTTQSLIEEYRLRALKFPTVTEQTIYQSNEDLRKIVAANDLKAVFAYQSRILNDIKEQNFYLYHSLNSLLNHALCIERNEEATRDIAVTVINGLTQSYQVINYQARKEGRRYLA